MFFTKLGFFWDQHWLDFGVLSLLLFFPAWLLRARFVTGYDKKHWITGKTETRKNVIDSYLYSSNVFFSGLSFVVSATFTLALAVERVPL